MKTHLPSTPKKLGVTLMEMTVVISLILLLVGMSTWGIGAYNNWQKGLEAGQQIQGVYAAQKQYLADNPTTKVTDLTEALVAPYMPDKSGAFPTVKGLDDENLTINIKVSPPVYLNGSDAYDPTGTGDGQWDVGE